MQTVSIVVSVFNEEEVLQAFWSSLKEVLIDSGLIDIVEIIFVNDGSVDCSEEILTRLSLEHDYIRCIHFSRNFGHEAAMICGIDYAKGDCIICLDSDLQHPPEEIPRMVNTARRGYDVILMRRDERADKKGINQLFSKYFYYLISSLSKTKFARNSSDFFLISKRVANILKLDYRERTRFLRGIIQIVGFNQSSLSFKAPARFAGKSKYDFLKLLNFSLEAIASFSAGPLNLGIITSLGFALVTFFLVIYSLFMYFFGNPVSGYTTLVILISLGFSINLFVVGLIGKYIGFIFNEVKERPLYIIKDKEGID